MKIFKDKNGDQFIGLEKYSDLFDTMCDAIRILNRGPCPYKEDTSGYREWHEVQTDFLKSL